MQQRYALGVAYDGTNFRGWQRQLELPTVQGTLEQALSQVANERITLLAAGRTDAGVHATGQLTSFTTNQQRELKAWIKGVNALCPKSVRATWVQPVALDFHPRFDATARRYIYVFHPSAIASPQLVHQVWTTPALTESLMHQAAQTLVGEHDFSSFRAAGCQSMTAMRYVHSVRVSRAGEFLYMDITANAFLLHMVRNIAGGLVQVGLGERKPGWIAELLAAKNRQLLGKMAPASGLYLVGVRCPRLDNVSTSGPGLTKGDQWPPLLRARSRLERW